MTARENDLLLEYENLRKELYDLNREYREKYPECVPLYTASLFRPQPVAKPYLETLCDQSFYKGYEMGISYIKGIREFEWEFSVAWNSAKNLFGTAQKHLDSFKGRSGINQHIRGYCFANGLEKSFNLNYEIILKNGVPTHLYDARNATLDKLKEVLKLDNAIREKLGMEGKESSAIDSFELRVKTEREALRNIKSGKFTSETRDVAVPLIRKDPDNNTVIVSEGPPEAEDGMETKVEGNRQVGQIVGGDDVDTGTSDVTLVKTEGDSAGETLKIPEPQPSAEAPESEELGVPVEPEEAPQETEEVPGPEEAVPAEPEEIAEIAPAEEQLPPEEAPVAEEELAPEVAMVEEEQLAPEVAPPAEEPVLEEEIPMEEEPVDEEMTDELMEGLDANAEEVGMEPMAEEAETGQVDNIGEGLNDAGINQDGDVSVDPDLTESVPEEEEDELSEFD